MNNPDTFSIPWIMVMLKIDDQIISIPCYKMFAWYRWVQNALRWRYFTLEFIF